MILLILLKGITQRLSDTTVLSLMSCENKWDMLLARVINIHMYTGICAGLSLELFANCTHASPLCKATYVCINTSTVYIIMIVDFFVTGI